MKLSVVVTCALLGYAIAQTTGGQYNQVSSTTFGCQDSTSFICGPCTTYTQVLYQYSTNSARLKTDNTCTSCSSGTSKGTITTEYYTNGTIISGATLSTGSQMCNLPSGQVTMSGYVPYGAEINIACKDGNGTVCGTCTNVAGLYYKRTIYLNSETRISYRCTSCTNNTRPHGTQVFQVTGSGMNVTTNWNVGEKTCKFAFILSAAFAGLTALLF